MAVRQKCVIGLKELVEHHPEGIDRRNGGVEPCIILTRKIIGVQDTEPFYRNSSLQ